MQIDVEGILIDVVIIQKKNKNIYLRFNEDGKLYITCPTYVKEIEIVYDDTIKSCRFEGEIILTKNEKMLNQFFLQEVKRVFTEEMNRLLPFFKNIPEFQLKFRSMKTRWGVNNRGSSTITLNTELLKKEIDLLDYVIIHELCHFYEANHSARFWKHVERYYPDYKMARKRLREE